MEDAVDLITQMTGAGVEVLEPGQSCSDLAVAPGEVAWPVANGVGLDRQNWGNSGGNWARGHTGTDFSLPCGEPVYAAHSGIVRTDPSQSGWAGPNFIKITTGTDSLATWYAHMSAASGRSATAPAATCTSRSTRTTARSTPTTSTPRPGCGTTPAAPSRHEPVDIVTA